MFRFSLVRVDVFVAEAADRAAVNLPRGIECTIRPGQMDGEKVGRGWSAGGVRQVHRVARRIGDRGAVEGG